VTVESDSSSTSEKFDNEFVEFSADCQSKDEEEGTGEDIGN